MKVIIECWIDHHYPIDEKSLKNLTDLYSLILNGIIFWKEDSTHDEKVTITIETEE